MVILSVISAIFVSSMLAVWSAGDLCSDIDLSAVEEALARWAARQRLSVWCQADCRSRGARNLWNEQIQPAIVVVSALVAFLVAAPALVAYTTVVVGWRTVRPVVARSWWAGVARATGPAGRLAQRVTEWTWEISSDLSELSDLIDFNEISTLSPIVYRLAIVADAITTATNRLLRPIWRAHILSVYKGKRPIHNVLKAALAEGPRAWN